MFTELGFTVIVGAGPTGLTLARQLDRYRVPYRIVEKSPHPFEGSRGKGLQPRTLEVLDDLGLLDRFLTAGSPYPPMRAHLPGGGTRDWRLDEPHEPTAEAPWPNTLMVPQWRTGELLADGIPVEYGVGVTAVTQDSVTLDTGEVVEARWIVGADGGRSTVRKALGIGFEGETFEEERLLIADVLVTGLDREHWHVWPGADGRSMGLGLCPLPGTDRFQLTTPPTDRPLAELVADFDPSITITDVGWTTEFRANIRMVSRYRSGNVFLAGDAAHVHSPAGGQGLNTGVQDAYNLGWKLATGDDALLDTYEAERLPVAAGVLGISSRLHRRQVEEGAEAAMRRDDPALRQLSLNYRGGPLAAEHRADPGELRAGDRMPDAVLDDGRRLFDVLRGPHATLLAVGWTGGMPTLPGSVQVRHLALDTLAGVREECLLLVRPDGYVGCATTDPRHIVEYAALIKVR
ncbi:FAD-dependent monooxygenase [Actinoplanes sp. NBRC 101535]|uniref:FAD-dependent monooxygenase n=1 Tax=Actinoplanes sp. NBRC 101535 TaxID=3032196 RepID=UPI0024A05AFB|nr:FAD-dependent monooxygenase [Actinoplanes sp. NBRC 101535]GLY01843.1 putative FAD-binding monooxygenase [Actinoplanes sp. NBRC 101535]